MLEEYMGSSRSLTDDEKRIIGFLAAKGHYTKPHWKEGLKAIDMQDGMGSLFLIPKGKEHETGRRLFKAQISDVLFWDMDSIPVLISLNIDEDGYLLELDVWKVNFDKVISYDNLFYIIDEYNQHR